MLKKKPVPFYNFSLFLFFILSSILFFYPSQNSFLNALSEDQILFLFTTCVQVAATLFGLTITGYIFLSDTLSKKATSDETLYDVIESLKKEYFKYIKTIGVLCFISILFCIFILVTYNSNHLDFFIPFLFSETILLVLFEVFFVVVFAFKALNPDHISNKSNEYVKKINRNSERGDLAQFLTTYNEIEEIVKTRAKDIVLKSAQFRFNTDLMKTSSKPQMVQSLNILFDNQMIDMKLKNQMNELRIYRNNLVHSKEPRVSMKMAKSAETILEQLKKWDES